MASRGGSGVFGHAVARERPAPPEGTLESRLNPPNDVREGVPRSGLLDRLGGARSRPVVLVAAPPGYGKTTLLVQSMAADPRPPAWLSLDENDNDPSDLIASLWAALSRALPNEPVFDHSPVALGWTGGRGAEALASIVAGISTPISLFLDDVHRLWDPRCVRLIELVAELMPSGSTVMLARRDDPGPHIARIRSRGRLLELGPGDLAMDEAEANALLRLEGIDVGDEEIAELVRRTEGWPVALYLAALAHRYPALPTSLRTFRGDHRYMADYIRSEVLEGLTDEEGTFLRRSSALPTLSGPLCDVALETSGSAETLDALSRTNLLLVPLDDHAEWFRYHRLLRDLLSGELRRLEPDAVGPINRRAAVWLDDHDLHEAAVACAIESDDADLLAGLVAAKARPTYFRAGEPLVRHWLEHIDESVVERWPALATEAASLYAVMGRASDAERWASLGQLRAERAPLSPSEEAGRLRLSALMCAHGVERMLADIQLACELEPSWSTDRPDSLALLGAAFVLANRPEDADRALAEALDLCVDPQLAPERAFVLAQRIALALELDDPGSAASFEAEARSVVHDADLESYSVAGLVFALGARLHAQRGAAERARADIARARELLPMLTHAIPWYAVQVRLELAHACLGLSDAGESRRLLRQSDEILRRRPALGTLVAQLEELRVHADEMLRSADAGPLTTAELRLLPLLPTHLSFAEIGAKLFISRSTVKTQAISIYRKLGVSSRSEAVTRARATGLLSS